jgi:tetratricopeptide (TPR) repeat protein
MLSKIYLVIFALLVLGGSAFYFASNSSYKNSFQARVYYFLGNYDKALEYAQIAYNADIYNKMAFTVLTQSKIAQSYEKYIEQGNEYLKKIDVISEKKVYTEADKIRIKMMCEVMMESFKELVPTALTNEQLQENSLKVYTQFKQLHEELF